MLLKLIKTRQYISGSHCEVWEINHETGNRLLGEVFVLNKHLPLELIYRVTVTRSGICFAGRHCVPSPRRIPSAKAATSACVIGPSRVAR